MKRASDSIAAAASTMPAVGAPMPPVPPLSPTPASPSASPGYSRLSGITSATPVSEAASILAEELRRVPGFEDHLALRLRQLDRRGPAPLRFRRAMRLAVGLPATISA